MRKGFNLSSSLSIANKLLRRKKYVKSRIERREEERRKTFCHWLKHSSSSRFAHKHSGKNIKRFLWRRDNKNLENPTPQNMCCTHIQHKKPRAAVIRSIISVPSKRVRESEWVRNLLNVVKISSVALPTTNKTKETLWIFNWVAVTRNEFSWEFPIDLKIKTINERIFGF